MNTRRISGEQAINLDVLDPPDLEQTKFGRYE